MLTARKEPEKTMPYTTADVVAFLKELPRKERLCGVCRSDNRSVRKTPEYPLFSVICDDCGNKALYNAAELIGKYGEYE